MAYLRIHCDVCGGTWEVYNRDDWKDDKARQCPHCFSKIDKGVWESEILPAFGAVQDANAELFKVHTGAHTPLFTFDVIADHIYANHRDHDRDNCPLIEQIDEIVDYLGL